MKSMYINLAIINGLIELTLCIALGNFRNGDDKYGIGKIYCIYCRADRINCITCILHILSSDNYHGLAKPKYQP